MRVDFSARSGGLIGIFFLKMKVYCMFSLESPHRGDSNEYTQYTIFNMNKKDTINYPKYGLFSKGLKSEFETAVVNEPSVFEPLKFFCSLLNIRYEYFATNLKDSDPTVRLHIRGSDLMISHFLTLIKNVCYDNSLKPSWRDDSNEQRNLSINHQETLSF